jgi:phytoene synthase
MPSLLQSYLHNQSLTKSYAKTFYFSLAFLNKEKRQDIYAVYGYCRYSDNLVDDEPDKIKAEKDLNLWRQKLQSGLDLGDSEDIVLKSFIHVVQKYKIDPKLTFELLDGMEMDLKQNRFETYEELLRYCYLVASVPGLLVLNILGFEGGSKTLEYASKLGQAMQITNILRDLKEDFERGRIYLPTSELQEFGVIENDFKLKAPNQELKNLMKVYMSRARSLYLEAQKGIPSLSKDSRFVVKIASKLYSSILDKIESRDYDVFSNRVHLSTLEKIWKIVGF